MNVSLKDCNVITIFKNKNRDFSRKRKNKIEKNKFFFLTIKHSVTIKIDYHF